MIKSEDNGSLYDFVDENYSAPVQEVPVKSTETPHANRQDLSQPYAGQFQQNVEQGQSAVAESKSNCNNEWMKNLGRISTKRKLNIFGSTMS